MMRIFSFLPLLGIPWIFYWIMAATGYFPKGLNNVLIYTQLPSGQHWGATWGDALVLSGVVLLYFELFKSTRAGEATIIDHALSTFVLLAYLIVWLIYPWGGNSVFLILTCMSFLDVIAGFTITLSAARRDISLGLGGRG